MILSCILLLFGDRNETCRICYFDCKFVDVCPKDNHSKSPLVISKYNDFSIQTEITRTEMRCSMLLFLSLYCYLENPNDKKSK